MGDVVNFGAKRSSRLEEEIRQQFLAEGSAKLVSGASDQDVIEWRILARAVARKMRRPVVTVVVGSTAHAMLKDWPADDHEQKIHDRQLRAAADAASLSLGFPHQD